METNDSTTPLRQEVERRRAEVDPSLINAFRLFSGHSTAVHVGTLLAGAVVWVLSYVAVVSVLGWGDTVVLETTEGTFARVVGASAATGAAMIYYGVLFIRAIGSPGWSATGPILLWVAAPAPVYTLGVTGVELSIGWPYLAIFVPYTVVAYVVWQYHFWWRFDSYAERVHWELENYPDGFLFVGVLDEEYVEGKKQNKVWSDPKSRNQVLQFYGVSEFWDLIWIAIRATVGIFLFLLSVVAIFTIIATFREDLIHPLLNSAQTFFVGAVVLYVATELWLRTPE